MKHSQQNHSTVKPLLFMALGSFVSMYVLMYAMVDIFPNVLPNINQFYMAGLMTSPMMAIEVIVMGPMYAQVRKAVVATSVFAGLFFFILIRQQALVADEEFLRSMIPHHGAAILMCQKAPIQDEEIRKLCEGIIASQQAEIDWMHEKLRRSE